MRLDKFITHATDLTRTQAQRAIRAGRVCVNGGPVRDPSAHIDNDVAVELDGRPVVACGARYYMLNKPAGYVCAARDDRHATVLDLLDVTNKADLHVAGRLDLDTTGLVLLSDDGEWTHRVTSPRRLHTKTYRVALAEPLPEPAAAAMARGLHLRGEKRVCAPAHIERIDALQLRVVITEGKYHQVRRMFAALGNHVLSLHRERIGSVALDADLPAGGFRPLHAAEIAAFA